MRGMKGGMRSEAITEQSDIRTGVAAEATRGGGSGLGRDGNATSTRRRAGKEGSGGRRMCSYVKKKLAGSLAETEGKGRALGGRGKSGGAGEEEEWREKTKREMRGDLVAAEAHSCKELRAAEED